MTTIETAAPQPGGAPIALEVRNVTSGYGHTTVLRDVSLSVPAGSVSAVVGPNGAGKSTLLKTISGLVHPTKGSITLDGKDVTQLRPNRRVRLGLCHIPEGRGIFPSLSVRENITIQCAAGTESSGIDRSIEAFPQLGRRLRQTAGTMSGGQQQMLALARAYVQNPKLILVDEASLGLAPLVVDAIFEFLENISARGASLLIVDQFIARALTIATTAHVMRRGSLVFSGSSAELLESDVFQKYIGDS